MSEHATPHSAAKCSCWLDGFAGSNPDPDCAVHATRNSVAEIERVAIAIFKHCVRADLEDFRTWDEVPDHVKNDYRGEAKAAIEELHGA